MNELDKKCREEARTILRSYLKTKRTLDQLQKGYLPFNEVSSNIPYKHYELIAKVEACISTLDEHLIYLIDKEYINRTTPIWWKDYYSRSTYYRLRNKALHDFHKIYTATED